MSAFDFSQGKLPYKNRERAHLRNQADRYFSVKESRPDPVQEWPILYKGPEVKIRHVDKVQWITYVWKIRNHENTIRENPLSTRIERSLRISGHRWMNEIVLDLKIRILSIKSMNKLLIKGALLATFLSSKPATNTFAPPLSVASALSHTHSILLKLTIWKAEGSARIELTKLIWLRGFVWCPGANFFSPPPTSLHLTFLLWRGACMLSS